MVLMLFVVQMFSFSFLILLQAVIQVTEVTIIHRTIIPLTMATVMAPIGGEDGTSRRLFPPLFLLLLIIILILHANSIICKRNTF